MTLIEALVEEQMTIISRGRSENYPLERSINDIDLIAGLTELKIKIRRNVNETFCSCP